MIREIPMIPPKPWPPGPEVIMPQAWGSVGKIRSVLPGGDPQAAWGRSREPPRGMRGGGY